MFTGLIDNTGRIVRRSGHRLEIETRRPYPAPETGFATSPSSSLRAER